MGFLSFVCTGIFETVKTSNHPMFMAVDRKSENRNTLHVPTSLKFNPALPSLVA